MRLSVLLNGKKWGLVAAIVLIFIMAFFPAYYDRVLASTATVGLNRISSGSALTTSAQQGPATTPGEVIHTGIYVLSVGNLDMTTGGYTMDFFLNFQCDTTCDPKNFDVMNAASAPEVDNQSADSTGTWYNYRVRANLLTNLNVKKYPFDSHNLVVELEDKDKNTTDMVYVVDPTITGIDENVLVSGWYLKPKWEAKVSDHYYPPFEENYSRYQFYVTIYHPWFAAFMKGLFAAIVIVAVGMLSLLMRHNAVTDRLALTSSTLVGAILYHLTLTSSIPPVGYLTYADEFMIINYLVVSAALGVAVMLMQYMNNNEEEKAIRLHKATRIIIPVMWVALLTVVTLYEFVWAA